MNKKLLLLLAIPAMLIIMPAVEAKFSIPPYGGIRYVFVGTDNVTAHMTNSNITLVEGSGMTISADYDSHQITFASSGGSSIKVNNVTCAGTDKVSAYDNVTGNFVCTTDETGGGGGEANTAANVGSGLGWFRDKTGVTLNFHSIVADQGLTATDTGDQIELDTDFKVNDQTCAAGDFISSYDNATGTFTCSTPTSSSLGIAQVRNTDTSTNLNTNSPTVVPITGTTDFMDSDFVVSGNGIQCQFTGRVEISASIHLFTTGVRENVLLSARIAGSDLGPLGGSGYIRDASGHRESSVHVHVIGDCNTNDLIDLTTVREASGNTVTMDQSGSSVLLVKRLT